MRTVFNNSELPHIWVHGNQDYGRNSNSSFYFRGNTIYSYGSHFPIAVKLKNKKGKQAFLFTTRHYGVTTAKHKNETWSSIRGNGEIFDVPLSSNCRNVEELHTFVCAYFKSQINEWYKEAQSGSKIKRYDRLQTMLKFQEEAIKYSKFFNLGLHNSFKLPVNKEDLEDLLRVSKVHKDKHDAQVEARRAVKRAEREAWWNQYQEDQRLRREQEEADKLLKLDEKIANWRSGKYANLPYDLSPMLRIKGDQVQTSKGAIFPLEAARRAIPYIKSVMDSGLDQEVSFRLGTYKIDKIYADGTVKAGCHTVKWEEIQRLELELFNLTT